MEFRRPNLDARISLYIEETLLPAQIRFHLQMTRSWHRHMQETEVTGRQLPRPLVGDLCVQLQMEVALQVDRSMPTCESLTSFEEE